MEMNGLNEAQLDLVYFALNHATAMARSGGSELPFTVADRSDGRELTWLEDATGAADLGRGDRIVVVQHSVLGPSKERDEIPVILVELIDGDMAMSVAQPCRPGGPHRRFAVLGEPFQLDLQPAPA